MPITAIRSFEGTIQAPAGPWRPHELLGAAAGNLCDHDDETCAAVTADEHSGGHDPPLLFLHNSSAGQVLKLLAPRGARRGESVTISRRSWVW